MSAEQKKATARLDLLEFAAKAMTMNQDVYAAEVGLVFALRILMSGVSLIERDRAGQAFDDKDRALV